MIDRLLSNSNCRSIPEYVLRQLDNKTEVDKVNLGSTPECKLKRATATVYVANDVYYVHLSFTKSAEFGTESPVFVVQGSERFADFMIELRKEVSALVG
jgi:hypothetical protein